MMVAGLLLMRITLTPFFPQTPGSLGAGVVKFTSLSNDDGTGTNYQNCVDGFVLRHKFYLVLRESTGHKKTGIFPGGKGKCWGGFGKINLK